MSTEFIKTAYLVENIRVGIVVTQSLIDLLNANLTPNLANYFQLRTLINRVERTNGNSNILDEMYRKIDDLEGIDVQKEFQKSPEPLEPSRASSESSTVSEGSRSSSRSPNPAKKVPPMIKNDELAGLLASKKTAPARPMAKVARDSNKQAYRNQIPSEEAEKKDYCSQEARRMVTVPSRAPTEPISRKRSPPPINNSLDGLMAPKKTIPARPMTKMIEPMPIANTKLSKPLPTFTPLENRNRAKRLQQEAVKKQVKDKDTADTLAMIAQARKERIEKAQKAKTGGFHGVCC